MELDRPTTNDSSNASAAAAATATDTAAAAATLIVSRDVGGHRFDIPHYYEPIRVVGKGAYGVVVSAKDTRTNESVAIKKVIDVFRHSAEVQKRILREVKILKHFNHRNIIQVRELPVPRSLSEFRDVYVVSELMSMDLRKVIHGGAVLTERHTRYILYQLLLALAALHAGNVIHRDLKPSNVLVNIADCHIKLCDFGLSRSITTTTPESAAAAAAAADEAEDFATTPENAGFFHSTTYVVSRWYRAPELILCWPVATKALDMWSVGCIFAELLTRRILFQGTTGLNQLDLILNVTGTPAPSEMRGTDEALAYLRRQPHRPPTPLRAIIGSAAPDEAIDLLERMLRFDPMQRISVEEALQHPYLNPSTLPRQAQQLTQAHLAAQPIPIFNFTLPPVADPAQIDFKALLYEEILHQYNERQRQQQQQA